MAGSQNFKVRKGLDVTDSATIGGGLIASGLQYPLSDGSSNEVIKTNGSGSASLALQSITKIRSKVPICGAAKPTPGAAYIVSSMSRAKA